MFLSNLLLQADIVQGLALPISLFLEAAVSGPVVQGIRALNKTICEGADLKGLVRRKPFVFPKQCVYNKKCKIELGRNVSLEQTEPGNRAC